MPLPAGTRLGPYEIVSPLGAGGMGEVYRARDTRLGRDVAVKVLPQHLSASPEVRARFEREARAVSSLNHPHICTLFDVGREGDADFLVMELVEGETLADRLERGALPLPDVLRLGEQIADALDKAHRAGIVHRDLKPGNVMLTKAGAKLMDFGLARAIAGDVAAGGASGMTVAALTQSPTVSRPLTAEGTIVGTFLYMAPEQLEGKDADARTDIWALGCVLYEMATGRRAFEGKSQASLIGAIMNVEPAPISQLAPLTPPALERTVKACLAKDPADRIQSAHDIVLELRWIAEVGSQAGVAAPVAARRRSRERLAWALAILGLAAAGTSLGILLLRPRDNDLVQVSLFAPEHTRLTAFTSAVAISPDGRNIAFSATDSTGQALWVRPLESDVPKRLTHVGGDPTGSCLPFWSPDGREIAYFDLGDRKLKRISVSGGSPVNICDPKWGRGGTWSKDGVIVFAPAPEGSLCRVPAGGGEVEPVTTLDATRGEAGHRFPQFLPDGEHFLFVALPPGPNGWDVFVGSLKSKAVKKIFTAGSAPIYADPGYLVFERQGNLMAQRFDVGRLELEGQAVAIAPASPRTVIDAEPVASASRNGRLIAFRSRAPQTRLQWHDRSGAPGDEIPLPPGRWEPFEFSPDGRQVAVLNGTDIWVVDLERAIPTLFAATTSQEASLTWSPDGHRIAFVSNRTGRAEIYIGEIGGAGEPQLIPTTEAQFKSVYDWSPDGVRLLFGELNASTAWDVWLLPMAGDGKPEPFLTGPKGELEASVSPDGKWLAYVSNESGQPEIYVQSFPKPGRKVRVSTDLGFAPTWCREGRELLYCGLDGWRSVPVAAAEEFRPGMPSALLAMSADADPGIWTNDGERLLRSVDAEETRSEIRVFLNWTNLLER